MWLDNINLHVLFLGDLLKGTWAERKTNKDKKMQCESKEMEWSCIEWVRGLDRSVGRASD